MNPRKRFSKKKKKLSKKKPFKRFFLFAFASVLFMFFAGWIFFTLPYSTDFQRQRLRNLFQNNSEKSVSKSDQLERETRNKIEFTFFDTLTKPEKQMFPTTNTKKQIPLGSLNKKRLNSSEKKSKVNKNPERSQSDEISKFIIQVGSFKDMSRAEDLIKRLDKKGYETFIQEAEIPNKGLWYRVFLRRKFIDRESALKLIEKIKNEMNLSAFLRRTHLQN